MDNFPARNGDAEMKRFLKLTAGFVFFILCVFLLVAAALAISSRDFSDVSTHKIAIFVLLFIAYYLALKNDELKAQLKDEREQHAMEMMRK
jgi:predicted Na+-dependent transporter